MNIRRIKRKIRKNKKTIIITASVIAVLLVIILLFTTLKISPTKQAYELTQVDVLSIKGIEGEQVMLKGVKLGDTQEKVLEMIGYPDAQTFFQPDITNMEFGKKAFNLNETGVILQFKGDSLAKITLLPAFNDLLHGKTKVEYTKDEFLITFGKPDSVKQMPESEGSVRVIRVYAYNEGIQFTTQRGIQIALSFVKQNAVAK